MHSINVCEDIRNAVDDMANQIAVSMSIIFCALAQTLTPIPCLAQFDGFELAPGTENTPIPRKMRSSAPTETDFRQIETYRGQIEKLFAASSYAEAEPLYQRYVALLERVGATERLGPALHNYAELLRRLNRNDEAKSIEARASALLLNVDESKIFSLKEYKLGMSLDDFNKLGAPSGADTKGVKLVCSCDAGQVVESVSEEDRKVDVIQCGFWKKDGDALTGAPYRMTVASILCSPDFRFIKESGVYRLYEISVVFFSSEFNDMRTALTSKYGQPKAQKREKITTGMGNIHQATNLIWDNGVSRITLSDVDGNNPGKARLRYLHRRLALAYATRVNENRAIPTQRASDDL